jgi:hypothetical protein
MDPLFYSLLDGTNSSLEMIMENEEDIFMKAQLSLMMTLSTPSILCLTDLATIQ